MIELLLVLIGADRFVATPPVPVLVVVLAPQGGPSSSDVLAAASDAFRSAAYVGVVSPEQVGLFSSDFEACPVAVRSSCWVKNARRASEARALVLVSIQNADRLVVVSFDLSSVDRGDEEAIEQAVWDRAIKSPPEQVDPLRLRGFFQRRAEAELGDLLRSIAPHRSFASVRITGIRPGAEIAIDGASLGVATSTAVQIAGVPIGPHRFGSSEAERMLDVPPGSVALDLSPAPIEGPPFRPIMIIGGGATAAAGIAMSIAAFVRGDGSALCVYRAPEDCGDPPIEVGGVRPLLIAGLGLASAGATWTLGALLFDREALWYVFAAGVALGSIAAGLTYALD